MDFLKDFMTWFSQFDQIDSIDFPEINEASDFY